MIKHNNKCLSRESSLPSCPCPILAILIPILPCRMFVFYPASNKQSGAVYSSSGKPSLLARNILLYLEYESCGNSCLHFAAPLDPSFCPGFLPMVYGAYCPQSFQSFFLITDIATFRLNQPRGQII